MVEQIERVRVVEDRVAMSAQLPRLTHSRRGRTAPFPRELCPATTWHRTLFIGERNLLVEGPSDLVYLDLISRHLRDLGREGLDEQWRILPAGGASNVPTFVALLGQKIPVTVLLDSGTEGVGKVEAAIKANKIAGGRVVIVGAVLEQQHSDIEDLFTAGDYLTLHNEAFEKKHKVGDLAKYADRIVLRLGSLDGGKLCHWKPAEVLLRNPTSVESSRPPR